ncbi:cobalt-precorrin-6x reductase [compost metagenome]
MITKESGAEGSVDEKVYAALDMGLYVILIARPETPFGAFGGVYDSFAGISDAVVRVLE